VTRSMAIEVDLNIVVGGLILSEAGLRICSAVASEPKS
jgi:hypothetical protein